MAYTLADIQGSTVVDSSELDEYINRCFEVTNKFFNALIILQPGIPLIEAKGKAALNKAYIEHLNSLIIGLCHDERLECGILCISRDMIDLNSRVRKVVGSGLYARSFS